MGKYKVLRPILEAGDTYSVGSVIELSDERALAIGSEHVEAVVAEASPVVSPAPEEKKEKKQGAKKQADTAEESA